MVSFIKIQTRKTRNKPEIYGRCNIYQEFNPDWRFWRLLGDSLSSEMPQGPKEQICH